MSKDDEVTFNGIKLVVQPPLHDHKLETLIISYQQANQVLAMNPTAILSIDTIGQLEITV